MEPHRWAHTAPRGTTSATTAFTPRNATASPSNPPITESTRLSVSDCRINLPSRRAQRQPHRRLRPARRASRQQQIRYVGAGDQQHQAAHRKQNIQAGGVVGPHHAYARPGRNDAYLLLGQLRFNSRHPIRGKAALVHQPSPQQIRQSAGQRIGRSPWLKPPNHPHPRTEAVQQRVGAAEYRLLVERQPYRRRIAAQRFAKETRRRNANHRKGMAVDDEGRTHHSWIGAVLLLPGAIAEHGDRSARTADHRQERWSARRRRPRRR